MDDSHAPRRPGDRTGEISRARTGRRRLFWLWVVLTAIVATYVGIAGPFASYFHEDMWMVAVVGPPLMIVLLSAGLGWLAWWVFGTRRHDGRR